MFYRYRNVLTFFTAILLLLLLAACGTPTIAASGAGLKTPIASTPGTGFNGQPARAQQAGTQSTFSDLTLQVQPYPTEFTVYEVGDNMSHVLATGTDDLGPGDPITATIDWGDKTASTQYTFIDNRTFQISAGHAYSKVGKYTITVTAAITIFQQSASGTGVINVVPDYALSVKNIRPVYNQAFHGVIATGTDPFFNDPLSGTIDWGDNTTPTSVKVTSSAQGHFQVKATHTYSHYSPTGSFTITISLTSIIVGPIKGTGMATLVPVFTLSAKTITARAGQPFNGHVATVTGTVSSGGLLVAIEWGDGTTSKLSLGGGKGSITIKGSHVYGQAGTYSIIVIIEDLGTGEQAHASGTAHVS